MKEDSRYQNLEEMYLANRLKMVNKFARKTGRQEAEDLVQEAFLAVLRHCGKGQDSPQFASYFYVVANHLLAKKARERTGTLEVPIEEEEGEWDTQERKRKGKAIGQAWINENRADVMKQRQDEIHLLLARRLVRRLNTSDRKIYLAWLDSDSNKAAAVELGMSYPEFALEMNRIRTKVRNWMKAEEENVRLKKRM